MLILVTSEHKRREDRVLGCYQRLFGTVITLSLWILLTFQGIMALKLVTIVSSDGFSSSFLH